MAKYTNLKPKTDKLLDNFIENIKNIQLTDDFARKKLLEHTEVFFDKANKLPPAEFANLVKKYNFSSLDVNKDKVFKEAFTHLAALVIKNYEESDLSRYLLPQDSEPELKPVHTEGSSRLRYWFQLLGYWFRQSRDKLNYTVSDNELRSAIKNVKRSFNEESYDHFAKGSTFFESLDVIVNKIRELSLHPIENAISRKAYSDNLAYQEALRKESAAIEQGKTLLQAKQEAFSKEKEEFDRKKQDLLQKEMALNEKKSQLDDTQKGLSEASALLKEEREAFNEKKQDLLQKEMALSEKKSQLHARQENFNQVSVLSENEAMLDEQNAKIMTISQNAGTPAVQKTQEIIDDFFTNKNEGESSLAINLDDLVEKFKVEFAAFKDKQAQENIRDFSRQNSHSSVSSSNDSDFWDTDWEDSEDEVDGYSRPNHSISLNPDQLTKLKKILFGEFVNPAGKISRQSILEGIEKAIKLFNSDRQSLDPESVVISPSSFYQLPEPSSSSAVEQRHTSLRPTTDL